MIRNSLFVASLIAAVPFNGSAPGATAAPLASCSDESPSSTAQAAARSSSPQRKDSKSLDSTKKREPRVPAWTDLKEVLSDDNSKLATDPIGRSNNGHVLRGGAIRGLNVTLPFKDADLLGIPMRITVGNLLAKEGLVELKIRKTRAEQKVRPAEVVATIESLRSAS